MEFQFSVFFTIVLLLVIVMKRFRSNKMNSKLPPGPWKLPLIGHLHHLQGLLPHHTLRDLSRKHGPLMLLQLGQVLSIVVSSPRLAKEVLKTNELVFANRGSVLIAEIVTYDGKGIVFSPYGGKWKQLRKICMVELLSAKKLKTQSFLSMIEEELKILVKDVSLMAGSQVNFSQKLFSLMNDITCRAAFGRKYVEEEAILLSLVKDVVGLSTGFAIPDVFPSLKFIHRISGARRRVEKLHEQIDKILEDIINDHRMKRKTHNSSKNNKMEEDLVDVLLRLQEEDKFEFHIENNCIKAVILEMFLAGSESLSTTTEWALSEMLRNPRVMKKAQAEVRRVLDGQKKVSQSDMNELSYLKLVIKETLRLHPPGTLLVPRESRERCEIDGYEIPKGTKVFTNAWAIGRDPEYWSDPETFNPERFQDLSIDYKGINFEFIPFGAGNRICPGMAFGVASIEFSLAQLLYHFDWTLPNGVKPEELDMTEHFAATVGRKTNLYLIPTPYRN